jgi:hypothetical protein
MVLCEWKTTLLISVYILDVATVSQNNHEFLSF